MRGGGPLVVAWCGLLGLFALVGESLASVTPERRVAGASPVTAAADAARAGDAGWLAQAQQHVAAREYHATATAEGLQAPNRAQNLRTWFDAHGIRVHDRTGARAELLRLSLAAIGRSGSLAPVAAGEAVVPAGSRVEIRRPGLVEWYENAPAGLEQGFTLDARPSGEGPLVLELALSGARAALRGDALALRTPTGRTLRYGNLIALDAAGRTLPAQLALAAPDRVRLVVQDADAAYPLVIDPLLSETADAQLESNQGDAQLGISLSGAGDVNGDGYADVIVGAPGYDSGEINEGAAFVFHGGPGGIANAGPASAATQLESNQEDFSASPQFGISVAGAGDVNGDGYDDVIVGAPFYSAGEAHEGAAFVFLGSPAGVLDANPSTAATQLESNQSSFFGIGPEFGYSVAGAGDVNGDGYDDVIVGAPRYDDGPDDEGGAFVFLGGPWGVADGTPASAAMRFQSNQANAQLGISVAGAGDTDADGYADVIIGADYYNAGETTEGAAFVLRGSATPTAYADPGTPGVTQLESNQTGATLGRSVAGAGDLNGDGYADVIVGAPSWDGSGTDGGGAFVFHGGPGGVAGGAAATLQSVQTGSGFGQSVAGAGDLNGDGYADVVVGARGYDAGETDEGAAFVFLGSAMGIPAPEMASVRIQSDQANAWLGWCVAAAGDVDGDGFADLLVGAHLFDAGQANEGVAWVVRGGSLGLERFGAVLAINEYEASPSASGAGDVNGDGYDDVILGAPLYDAGEADEGAAFVFLGGPAGVGGSHETGAATTLESNQAGALFGFSVAGAGDVNGDGYGDVIVGANGYDAGSSNEGAAFVFLGGAAGIPDGDPGTASARLESDQASGLLGASVAGAGDVDGDGYADVLVGADGYDAGQGAIEGLALLFLGGPAGVANGNPGTAAARYESEQGGARFGHSVASAGDVNSDGYADVIIGAPDYDPGLGDPAGAAFVFHGAAAPQDGTPATAATRLHADQAFAGLGRSVSAAGDVDGDGHADVLVGAPGYEIGAEFDEGVALVFHGSPSGIADATPAMAAAIFQADVAGAAAGTRVAGAGDVNGDGYADVVVGAPDWSSGGVLLLFGSASGIANSNIATADIQILEGSARYGTELSGAGDVNADGFADVLLPSFVSEITLGAALVVQGHGAGRPVLARQRRGDGSGIPVAPWGGSGSTTGFRAELHASHPEGSGRVRAEFEACPVGVPMGDASCVVALSPTWEDVGPAAPEVLLSHTFDGLSEGSLYRWRARALHAAATGPLPLAPAAGPWRRPHAQSVEADVRVVPEPGVVASLAAGITLLAVLASQRRRRHGA